MSEQRDVTALPLRDESWERLRTAEAWTEEQCDLLIEIAKRADFLVLGTNAMEDAVGVAEAKLPVLEALNRLKGTVADA